MKQTVDGFRVVAQALLPASHAESASAQETISDEAIDNARDIIGEALEVYRRKASGSVTPIDPRSIARVLRMTVEHSGQLPLTLFVTGDPATAQSAPGATEMIEFMRRDILCRGHRLHLVLGRDADAERPPRKALCSLMDAGARVRSSPCELPTILTLGTESAILRTAGGPVGAETLLVRGAAVVTILHRIQLALWEQAVDFGSGPRGRAATPVLDNTQSQVLYKLCEGMKDETAARQMNVSVRTYRRHVAGILKSLEVSSRFEAGLKVAELGLLAGPRPGRQ